ncbi:unnamed protein product [Schistocephalus solidus]|uniref:Zinc finger CCCH-type with G patch domain-containing protein n=2 Tax=Schistocephalus solidus TaxID=70667 RepID=A0A183T3A0_SCHSO|nr:unnamed protein product [Schistocephalus solidus]
MSIRGLFGPALSTIHIGVLGRVDEAFPPQSFDASSPRLVRRPKEIPVARPPNTSIPISQLPDTHTRLSKPSVESDPMNSGIPASIVSSRPTANTVAEAILPAAIRSTPVRLVCLNEKPSNALSEALISVQPQFTLLSSPAKLASKASGQLRERSIAPASAVHGQRVAAENETKTNVTIDSTSAFTIPTNPVTILTPTKNYVSSQLMPLVQSSELKTHTPSPRLSPTSGGSLITAHNTPFSPSGKGTSLTGAITALPIVTVGRAEHTIPTISPLHANSSTDSVCQLSNQPMPSNSVCSGEISLGQTITPNRKRARKQQLLAPHGVSAAAAASRSESPSKSTVPVVATSVAHVNLIGMLPSAQAVSSPARLPAPNEQIGERLITKSTVSGKVLITSHSNQLPTTVAPSNFSFYSSPSVPTSASTEAPKTGSLPSHALPSGIAASSGNVMGIRLLPVRPSNSLPAGTTTPQTDAASTAAPIFATQIQPSLSLVVNSSLAGSVSQSMPAPSVAAGIVSSANLVVVAPDPTVQPLAPVALPSASTTVAATITSTSFNSQTQPVYVLPAVSTSTRPSQVSTAGIAVQPALLGVSSINSCSSPVMIPGSILQVRFRPSATPSSASAQPQTSSVYATASATCRLSTALSTTLPTAVVPKPTSDSQSVLALSVSMPSLPSASANQTILQMRPIPVATSAHELTQKFLSPGRGAYCLSEVDGQPVPLPSGSPRATALPVLPAQSSGVTLGAMTTVTVAGPEIPTESGRIVANEDAVMACTPVVNSILTSKSTLGMVTGQPAVPILRVPDPNARQRPNCFDDLQSPCKRVRKQSTSCTTKSQTFSSWELHTDPTDSTKCIWRAPEKLEDQSADSAAVHEVDTSDSAEWVIHGCPARMHLCRPSYYSARFGGCWKGPKAGHFLRSSEIRQKHEHGAPSSRLGAAGVGTSSRRFPNDRRRRPRLRDTGEAGGVESPGGAEVSNLDHAILSEILDLRCRQTETGFVNHPIHTTSPLDLTGWRLLWCLKNLEDMKISEFQGLERVNALYEAFIQPASTLALNRSLRSTAHPNATASSTTLNGPTESGVPGCPRIDRPNPATSAGNTDVAPKCDSYLRPKYNCPSDLSSLTGCANFTKLQDLIRGLGQRKKVFLDGIERVRCLSLDILHQHQKTVLDFVSDLEVLRYSSPNESSKNYVSATLKAPPGGSCRSRSNSVSRPNSPMFNISSADHSRVPTPDKTGPRRGTTNAASPTNGCAIDHRVKVTRLYCEPSLTFWLIYPIADAPIPPTNHLTPTQSFARTLSRENLNLVGERSRFTESTSRLTAMDTELQSLRETLADVDQLLELSEDNSADLLSLKEDLEQLIHLKEADLLERSKQTALAAVDSALESLSPAEHANSEADPIDSQQTVDSPTLSSLQEREEELPGSRCSLPGWTSRGYFVHRNAVIAEVLDEGSLPSRRVRLFFTNPTRLGEVPCAQFLETGTCSRGARCRKSHGEVTSIEDLRDWEEPDPASYLREGQLCLALECDKPSHSLVWHHARIQHTDVDEGTCVVQWCAMPASATASHHRSGIVRHASYSLLDASVSSLPLSHVHPISSEEIGGTAEDSPCLIDSGGEEGTDLLESSESSDETLFGADFPSSEAEGTSKISNASKVTFSSGGILEHPVEYPMVVSAGDGNADQEPLGAWELHTRGVGSRLLRLMGYTGRGGLGRLGDGRRQPVSSDVTLHCIVDLGLARPSLDRLVQLRRGKPPGGNRRHRHQRGQPGMATAIGGFRQAARLLAPSSTVFDYLNRRVLAAPSPAHVPTPKAPGISSKSRKELNIEHYNIQREITRVESEMARAEESLKRNESRDRRAAASASHRLTGLRTKLTSLRNHERALSRETAKQKNKEKLCIF